MTRELTAAGELVLDSKTVPIKFSVKIDGVANPDVISYDYRFDRNFGSSSLTVTLLNEGGKYGPGQHSEIELGTTIELIEGLYVVGGHEDFNRFYGIARQIRPSIRQGQSIIVLTAYDYIIKLEDWEIEKEFEATKVEVKNEKLSPVRLPAPNNNLAQIYNAAHNDWAEHPMPLLKIQSRSNRLYDEPLWQGFEINSAEGQVILGTPLNVSDFDVYCGYHYYPSGKYVEDIIEEIVIAPDGYGNAFSATTYLRENFTSFTGLTTDIMTPNYVEETIDGTTYAAGRLWYLSYNNLTTTLSSGNFTVPGASIQAIDKRYGRIRLNHSISLTAVVTCNVNYTFKTIQATGIEVPYINFTSRKTKNRFEALRQIRELVAPNYLIRTIGTKKIWAAYINQKYNPDYTLKLTTALNYAEDQDISTRVKVFGKNLNPTNLTLGKDVHFEDLREEYTGYTYQQELSYWKGWGDWNYDPNSVRVDYVDDWQELIGSGYGEWLLVKKSALDYDNYKVLPTCLKFWGKNHGGWTEEHPDWTGSSAPGDWVEEDAIGSVRTPLYDVHDVPRGMGIEFFLLTKFANDSHYPAELHPKRIKIEVTEYTSALDWRTQTRSAMAVFPKVGTGAGSDFGSYTKMSAGMTLRADTYFVRFEIVIEENWQCLRLWSNTFWFGVSTECFIDCVNIWAFNAVADDSPHSEGDWVEYKVFPVAGQTVKILQDPWPIVYLNGVKIGAGNPIQVISSQVLVRRIISYPSVEEQDYRYVIVFSHSGLSPQHPISLYRADGSLYKIIEPSSAASQYVDYINGSLTTDRGTSSEDLEMLSTASYYVSYSSNKVDFNWNEGIVKVAKSLLNRQQRTDIVSASFAYETMVPLPGDIGTVSDGRWTTQCQLEFYGQPLKGLPLFTIDLGAEYRIDAIDLTSGFYKPDLGLDTVEMRRFDVSNWFTLQYSLDGTSFYPVCGKANNFHLGGGESISFEEGDIPELFDARYFRLILEDSNKIDFEDGRWCVPICEFAVYKDLILKGEAILVSSHSQEDETHLYDYGGLLATVGDKLFKLATVNPLLSTQARMDRRVGSLLGEFQKDHTKASVDVMYAPHIELGQTVNVINPVTGEDQDYFIEGVSGNKGKIALNLAYYPGLYS